MLQKQFNWHGQIYEIFADCDTCWEAKWVSGTPTNNQVALFRKEWIGKNGDKNNGIWC